jgi:hypothetical protein
LTGRPNPLASGSNLRTWAGRVKAKFQDGGPARYVRGEGVPRWRRGQERSGRLWRGASGGAVWRAVAGPGAVDEVKALVLSPPEHLEQPVEGVNYLVKVSGELDGLPGGLYVGETLARSFEHAGSTPSAACSVPPVTCRRHDTVAGRLCPDQALRSLTGR